MDTSMRQGKHPTQGMRSNRAGGGEMAGILTLSTETAAPAGTPDIAGPATAGQQNAKANSHEY